MTHWYHLQKTKTAAAALALMLVSSSWTSVKAQISLNVSQTTLGAVIQKMRRRFFPILLLLACVIGGDYPQAAFAHDKAQATSCLTQFVNPRIGTGGHGHVFLGANVPFGYIQLDLLSIPVVGTGVPVIISQTPFSSALVISTSAERVSEN